KSTARPTRRYRPPKPAATAATASAAAGPRPCSRPARSRCASAATAAGPTVPARSPATSRRRPASATPTPLRACCYARRARQFGLRQSHWVGYLRFSALQESEGVTPGLAKAGMLTLGLALVSEPRRLALAFAPRQPRDITGTPVKGPTWHHVVMIRREQYQRLERHLRAVGRPRIEMTFAEIAQ